MGSVLSLLRWTWDSWVSGSAPPPGDIPPESSPIPAPPPPEPVSGSPPPPGSKSKPTAPPSFPPYAALSFSPAPHSAQPFPSRAGVTSLEFLKEACPDAHAYTDNIIHTSMGAEIEDVIPQRNGFVHTILECYNKHHALTIRPDDVWTAILTQFSCYVNGNAEALRSLFVLHYDKKELTVEIDQPRGKEDWGFVVKTLTEKMEDQIQENVIDPELKHWITPAFSTTNATDKLVAGMLMMATVKQYFTFRIVLRCGIPRVTLEGTKDDWEYVLNRTEKLKEFGPQATAWYRLLHPVLSRFVRAFDEPNSAENLDFWNRVAHVERFGSGSPTLTGWITAFMVFDEQGHWKGDDESDLVLDGVKYPCLDSNKIPAGYAQVDVLFQRKTDGIFGPEQRTSLIAGSVGTKIFSSGDRTLSNTGKRDSARPALGWWWVFKKEMEPQKSIPAPGDFHWRCVDARAFIYSGVVRLVPFKDIGDLDFVAISYVWSDGIKKWRNHIANMDGRTYEEKIARGSGKLATSPLPADVPDHDAIEYIQLLFTVMAFLVLTRGKKYFWIDILCINQDEQLEKNFFVPRMGDLYRGAAETHAYPFGANLPSSLSSKEVYFPIWETRAWTVQEQVLSQNVLFCHVFQGDVRQGLKSSDGDTKGSGPARLVDLRTPVLDRYQYSDGIYLLQSKGSNVTCRMRQESWMDFSMGVWATSAMMSADSGDVHRGLQRGTGYRALSLARKSLAWNTAEAARLSMTVLAGGRKSTVSEDMIYSVLGALDLGNFAVEYQIGFEEARLRVFEALGPEMFAHIVGTEWCNGSSANNKDSALPRVVDAVPIACVTSLQSAIRHCKYTRNVGTQMTCRRETCRVWAPGPDIKIDQNWVQLNLGSDRLLLMQTASVFDLPGSASMPTGSIPRELTKVIIADRSTFGVSSDEEASKVDRIVEFVEIGMCDTGALVWASLMELNGRSSLLTLCCEETESGSFVNRGTALMMDASALSTEYSDILIE